MFANYREYWRIIENDYESDNFALKMIKNANVFDFDSGFLKFLKIWIFTFFFKYLQIIGKLGKLSKIIKNVFFFYSRFFKFSNCWKYLQFSARIFFRKISIKGEVDWTIFHQNFHFKNIENEKNWKTKIHNWNFDFEGFLTRSFVILKPLSLSLNSCISIRWILIDTI